MRHVRLLVLSGALLLALAPAALADWDHDVKWDQLESPTTSLLELRNSYIGNGMELVADDFECFETGYITDIEFYGYSPNLANLDEFRITFWSDLPDTIYPAELLADVYVPKAEPGELTGWAVYDSEYTNTELYKINLPMDDWFVQYEDETYWIGIQGVYSGDGVFNWRCLAEAEPKRLEDASTNEALVPTDGWDHLVWVDVGGFMTAVVSEEEFSHLEQTTLLGSADMSFRLTGTAIPEPATMTLLCAAGLLFLSRFKRKS